MKSIIAKREWFDESDLRLDASFHLSDSVLIKHKYIKSPVAMTTINEQAVEVFLGNIFKRIYVADLSRGVPYLTGSDMIKSDIESGKYLAKKQAQQLKHLMLKKGWILVSCSGTLGNVVFTNDMFENHIATHDLIRIIPNNKDVKSGFLFAYLASKYGYALLTQSSYGGVVKHIEPEHIYHIPVPIFPPENQEEIHNLITQAADLRVEANNILNKTKELFYKEYSIDNLRINYEFSKNIKLSQIANGFQNRIDSISYINRGLCVINELMKNGVAFHLLGNILEIQNVF
ncbi:MAG TPA: restriction endonuclease subunit S [Bacteroidales bacterium]|nr:restriction endonuclease subunit S [Bacteroidales bacterium]